MTRKDYILIARALHEEYASYGIVSNTNQVVFGVAQNIAIYLQRDNPRFDREHFLAVVRGEKDLNSRPARS